MGLEGARAPLHGGAAYLGPVAILLTPFTAAYGAARGAECDAKLNSAYPDASTRLRDVVQREFVLGDLQEQFVTAFQKRTVTEVVALSSPDDQYDASDVQQLLNAAAHRPLAYLLVVDVLGVDLTPLDIDCEHWAFRVGLHVSIWGVADGKRVAGTSFTYPYVNAKLNSLQSIMEETGALRTRLVPNFGIAASGIIEQRRFVLLQ